MIKREKICRCLENSRVVDSRNRGKFVWRRRKCLKCKRSFHTIEKEELEDIRDVNINLLLSNIESAINKYKKISSVKY